MYLAHEVLHQLFHFKTEKMYIISAAYRELFTQCSVLGYGALQMPISIYPNTLENTFISIYFYSDSPCR